MDFQYLLWLQNFRESTNNVLTPFLMSVSDFAIFYSILIPTFIYWCINKRNGLYVFFVLSINGMLASFVKLTACVYRPWIKDPRIIPAGNATQTATGYSFPSGHTTMSTAIYGSTAVVLGKKLFYFLAVIGIFLTAFSRNYLGVHTPQDVIFGFLLAVFSIYVTSKGLKYFERNRGKENLMLTALFIFGLFVLVYAEYKPYPMDYVDGKLIVDPQRMTLEAWHVAGQLLGCVAGRFIEKHYVKFSPRLNFRGIIFTLIGMLILYFIIKNLTPFMRKLAEPHYARMAAQFLTFFYVIVIWPAVMKIFNS